MIYLVEYKRKISAFRTDCGGNVALIFALALVAILGAVGLAVDYSRVSTAKVELQSALDAAVLAAIRTQEAGRVAEAERYFDAYPKPATLTVASRAFSVDGGKLSGTAAAQVDTTLFSVVAPEPVTVGAASTAEAAGAAVCILINNPSSSNSLLVNSGVNIVAPECEIHVRSTGSPAAMINDGQNINVQRICIKSANVTQNGSVNPAVQKDCDAISNPFVGTLPAVSASSLPSNNCSSGGMNFSSTDNDLFVPGGNYCGMNFNGTYKAITLGAGKYSSVNLNTATTVTLGAGSYENVNVNGTIKTLNLGAGYYKGLNLNTGETVNLNPGTFENLTVNSGPQVINMAPGLYVWKGTTTLNTAKLVGTGVTIYYPDRSSFIQVNTGASLALSAPTSGTYSGILMYEPDGLSASSFSISGSASQVLDGLIYWPSRTLTFNASSTVLGDKLSLVVDKMTINTASWKLGPASKRMTATGGGAAQLTR